MYGKGRRCTHRSVHTQGGHRQGGLWPPQEFSYLRVVWGWPLHRANRVVFFACQGAWGGGVGAAKLHGTRFGSNEAYGRRGGLVLMRCAH